MEFYLTLWWSSAGCNAGHVTSVKANSLYIYQCIISLAQAKKSTQCMWLIWEVAVVSNLLM